MAAVSKLEALEAERGKSIAEILREAYQEHGQQSKVADALKITPSTLSRWLLIAGLEEKTHLVPRVGYLLTEKARRERIS